MHHTNWKKVHFREAVIEVKNRTGTCANFLLRLSKHLPSETVPYRDNHRNDFSDVTTYSALQILDVKQHS